MEYRQLNTKITYSGTASTDKHNQSESHKNSYYELCKRHRTVSPIIDIGDFDTSTPVRFKDISDRLHGDTAFDRQRLRDAVLREKLKKGYKSYGR